MSPSLATMLPPTYAPSWPRHRRLSWTWGPKPGHHGNPNYRHGRSCARRVRIQGDLERALAQLAPARLVERIIRLRPEVRAQVNALLGQLTSEYHPERWALPDARPDKPRRWYVPPVALRFACAWLRKAREVQRLIFFDPALLETLMPSVLKKGPKGTTGGYRRTASDEIARLRTWTRARGVPWDPPTPPAET